MSDHPQDQAPPYAPSPLQQQGQQGQLQHAQPDIQPVSSFPQQQQQQHPGMGQEKAYSYNGNPGQQFPPQQGQQPPQMQQMPSHGPVAAQGFQTAVPITALGPGPAPIDCPACGYRQMTRVEFENGNTVYAWALGLCVCFCLGCIPFCINSLKDVAHFCGHCGTRVATHHRSGATEQHVHR